MKRIILSIAVIVVASSAAFAQKIAETAVPKVVLTSYQKSFTGTSGSTWQKESKGDFLVGFTQNNMATTATFNAAGNLLKSVQEVYITQLPQVILDYVYANYNTRTYVGASKVTAADGKVTYDTQIKIGKDLITLVFDDKYSFVSKAVATTK